MCGLVGVAFLGDLPHEQEVLRQQIAWYLSTELLVATQTRGDDATGVATIFNDGNYIGLKMGVMATEFIARAGGKETDYDGYLKIWRKCVESPKHKYAKLFMGHCRKTTLGSVFDNDNNHPIHIEPILGIHNGTITNHDTIFDNLKTKRIGTVDSESIFSLLHHYTDEGKKEFTKEILHEVTKRLHGTYAVIASNSNNPNQVAIFRDGRPLILHVIKPLNMIVLISDEILFQMALYRYNKEVQLYDNLYGTKRGWPVILKKDIDTVTLRDEHLSIIDLTNLLAEDFKTEDLIPQYQIPRIGKMWEKKTQHNAAWERNNAVWDQNNARRLNTTPTTPAKETVKDKTKAAGFIWLDDAEAYVELTEGDLKKLEQIGSIELRTEINAVKAKDALTGEDIDKTKLETKPIYKLTESKGDTTETIGQRVMTIGEVKVEDIKKTPEIISGAAVEDEGTVVIVQEELPKDTKKVSVDLWKNPDFVKKAAQYANTVSKVENEKDIAEILGLSSVKEVESLPLVALVNKVRKITADMAYYDANVREAAAIPDVANIGMRVVRGKKRDVVVGSAKKLLKVFISATEAYEENSTTKKRVGSLKNFLDEALLDSRNKLFYDDLTTLFTPADLKESPMLKDVYTKLPHKSAKV